MDFKKCSACEAPSEVPPLPSATMPRARPHAPRAWPVTLPALAAAALLAGCSGGSSSSTSALVPPGSTASGSGFDGAALPPGTVAPSFTLTDQHGRLLAGTAGSPHSVSTSALAALSPTQAGSAWFSNLFRGSTHQYMIEEAIPFRTRFGVRAEMDHRAATVAQLQMAGDKVGVEMGEEDVSDLESGCFRVRQVLLDVALRIDDDRR